MVVTCLQYTNNYLTCLYTTGDHQLFDASETKEYETMTKYMHNRKLGTRIVRGQLLF